MLFFRSKSSYQLKFYRSSLLLVLKVEMIAIIAINQALKPSGSILMINPVI